MSSSTTGPGIDDVMARLAAEVHRPSPAEAAASGALIVDTRPEAYRRDEGEIPGALVLERNVLEWRFTAGDGPLVVVCNEGYASVLAAASLRALGVDATDLAGGFRAWKAAGLPVREGGPTASESTVPSA